MKRLIPTIEIDSNSGFCFGVVTAINKAEAELERSGRLACLGDIVHNRIEVQRLERLGLRTVTHDDMERLRGQRLFIRAHGEPPGTYARARELGIETDTPEQLAKYKDDWSKL